MKNKRLWVFLFLTSFSGLIAREGLQYQEVKIQLNEFEYKLNGHQTEIDILHEKYHALEQSLAPLKKEIEFSKNEGNKERSPNSEKRFATLEKNQETFIQDLKLLRDSMGDLSKTIALTQSKLSDLDIQHTQDMKSLKSSLNSMIALLQKGESSPQEENSQTVYTVKPGDSLGKISIEQKIDLKKLKEINHLTSDRIVIGQKLKLSR
jgi:hypothetical protein